MKIITDSDIKALELSPIVCYDWIREAFAIKNRCQLPPKESVHPQGNDFITTMPCLLPPEYGRFGVKVVSRIKGNVPSLRSDLMLFDSTTGALIAIVDCDWITPARTGAVATLAIETFRSNQTKNYAFLGLGSTARATLRTLLEVEKNSGHTIKLLRYKNQAEKLIEEFAQFGNATFIIVDNIEKLVKDTDVLVSCITEATELIVKDTDMLKPGILIVPVHTRGFQNCDTVFEKIYGDDRGHIAGFRYFSQFKEFHELGEVLAGTAPGRESDKERILSYNIGLGLHDVLFASKIYNLIK